MNKIIFRPVSKDVELLVPPPRPAKVYIPDWLKKVPMFSTGKLEIDQEGNGNATLKQCPPFLDSYTTGYIQETWVDLHVKIMDNDFEYIYPSEPRIIDHRPDDKMFFPTPPGFYPQEFTWKQPWIPQLPDGWSMIYTQPFNRFDLPFQNLGAIVDNDKFYMEKETNHPFFFRNGFEGIIPKGTPYMQMIPMKRDSWRMETEPFNENLSTMVEKIRQYFVGGYKKLYHQKKDFK